MNASRKYVAALAPILLIAGTGAWILQDSSEFSERPPLLSIEAAETTGFVFPDAYRNTRSRWFAGVFAADRASLVDVDLPEATRIEVRVHEAPFSSGPLIDALEDEAASRREEDEKLSVESRVTFLVPDVEPERMIAYLAFSGFLERVGEPGEYDHELSLDTPPSGSGIERLGPGQFVTREQWIGGTLAKPTAVSFVNRIARDGDVLAAIYELWSNDGDAEHVEVRVSTGQFACRRATGGGSLVELHTFYRGQGYTLFAKAIVIAKTRSFYERYVELIRTEAPGWSPSPEVLAWLEAQGWQL